MTPAQRCATYGHNNEVTKVTETCVTKGYTLTICTRCGHKEVSDETKALGHEWDSEITKEATCTENGNEHFACLRCDVTYDKTINAIGHSFKAEEPSDNSDRYKAPTCTEKGKRYVVCENCADEYEEDLPQLEHEYVTEEIEADCNNSGYKHHKCKHCNHEYDSDHKAARGHAYEKDGKCKHCAVECEHEYKYGVCIHCQHQKEKPATPEEHKHQLIYSYEFVNENSKRCEDGVIITVTCESCDHEEIIEAYECYTWEVHVDLSGYDTCGAHNLDYITCPCSRSFEFIGDPALGETLSYDTDEETYESATYGCPDCALTGTATESIPPEDTCEYTVSGWFEFKIGDQLIERIEIEREIEGHEFESEVTLKDGATSCEEGVIVSQTCAACGIHKEFEITEHEPFDLYVDVSEYGCCDSHDIHKYMCACGEIQHSMFWNRESFLYEYDGETELYYCEDCDLTIRSIGTETEKSDESCMVFLHTTYEVKSGDTVVTRGVATDWTNEHEFEVTSATLLPGAASCEDGIKVTERCSRCGDTYEGTVYDHSYAISDVDLSSYDVCPSHTLQERVCRYCNEVGSIRWGEFNSQITIDNGWILSCNDCDLQLEIIYEWSNGDGCASDQINTYTATLGDTVILQVTAKVQTVYDHAWDTTVTFMDGATSCEDGVIISQVCTKCGQHFDDVYYEHYMFEKKFDFSGHEICNDHNITGWSCACGEVIESLYWEWSSFNVQSLKEGQWLHTCDNCDITILETEIEGEKHENCFVDVTWVYDIKLGEELVKTVYGMGRKTDHEWVETAMLKEGATSCMQGAYIEQTCVNCGFSTEREVYEHESVEVERVMLADYGHSCGTGEIWVFACACGENSGIGTNTPGFSRTINADKQDVFHQTYTCTECQFSFDWMEEQFTDAFCNLTRRISITAGNQVVLENVITDGQSHNREYKRLPDECGEVTHEDGSYTSTVVEEVYCSNCLASLGKTKTVTDYDANGLLQKSLTYDYSYVALGENETGTVLDSTVEYAYLTVKNVLADTYSSVEEYRLSVYYDEIGNVRYWQKVEYEYADGNYCSFTEKHTNSNGESWSRPSDSQDHRGNSIWAYELSEGSTSCFDGVDRVSYCVLCGEEKRRNSNWGNEHYINQNQLMRTDSIDLSESGSVCGGYLNIYACACGGKISIATDSKCDFEYQGTYSLDDDRNHRYDLYVCAVTHPEKCGFKYVVESWSSADESCNEIAYKVLYLGLDAMNTTCESKHTYSYHTGKKAHAELVTETTYDGNESRADVVKCAICGLIEEESEIKNHIKTRVDYRYNANGVLTQKTTSKGLYPAAWTYSPIQFDVLNEYYDVDGSVVFWDRRTYDYPKADEGNFCCYSETNTNSDGLNITTEVQTIHRARSSPSWPCVYDEYVCYCNACGEILTEESWGNGHSFRYDEEKQLYICYECGLETISGGNGTVNFEDLSVDEGNGSEYIIGFDNHYEGSYIWNLSLVVEDAEDFIMLDDVNVEQMNEHRVRVDAKAVETAAKELGYDTCDYMVRVAFVPTDANGELEYAITLDPHIWLKDEANTVVSEDGCNPENPSVYAYKCALCSSKKVEYASDHDYFRTIIYKTSFNANGEMVITETNIGECLRCDWADTNETVTTYYPNGEVKSKINAYSEAQYEYDFENDIYTLTTRNAHNEDLDCMIEKGYISSNQIIYREYHYSSGSTEIIQFIWHNGKNFISKLTYIYPDGTFRKTVCEYDFENDIKIETITYTDGRKEIVKSYISTDQVFETTFFWSDGSVQIYEYIRYNDIQYISKMIRIYPDESVETWEYTYLFEEDIKIQTVTNVDGTTQTTKIYISTNRAFENEIRYQNGDIRLREYIYYNESRYISKEVWTYAGGTWEEAVHDYGFENDIKTTTVTGSNYETASVTQFRISTGEIIT